MAPGSRPAAAVHSQHAPTKRHLTLRAAWVDPRKASGYKHFLALAGVAQLARACACQAQGRRFDPDHPLSVSRKVAHFGGPVLTRDTRSGPVFSGLGGNQVASGTSPTHSVRGVRG